MKNENYIELFKLALAGEGKLDKGFSNFHRYSFGNQMLAMWQMMGRGIEITPIATFKKWQSLGRQVTKGSKAIELCMPVSIKDKDTGDKKVVFVYKRNWFAMSQTEGEDVEFPKTEFDFEKALRELNITKVAFNHVNGNVQGYAKGKTVAINPLCTEFTGTLIHEMAHVLLGHTEGESEHVDEVTKRRDLKEVEAEGVALCVKLALGEGDTEYQVGYIKNWWKGEEIPADSIKKIFKVSNAILRAGQEKEGEAEASS